MLWWSHLLLNQQWSGDLLIITTSILSNHHKSDKIAEPERMTNFKYCVSYLLKKKIVLIILYFTGAPPVVGRANFNVNFAEYEGMNISLTASVSSIIPLSSDYPKWKINFFHEVPSNAMYSSSARIDGKINSTLSLHGLKLRSNSGNYTCTAKNICGSSFVFGYMTVLRGRRSYSCSCISKVHFALWKKIMTQSTILCL